MAALAARREVPLLDDLGSGASGAVFDVPTVGDFVGLAAVVTFSGYAQFGGPQAGIALGRAGPIQQMAKHPLARAVRVDKMTLAALEVTLRQRLLGGQSPVARMLTVSIDELRRRAGYLQVRLAERGIECDRIDGASAAGGGSLPGHDLPTVLLALPGHASGLAAVLRRGHPPVLARIEDDRCCIDLRTVLRGQDDQLQLAIEAAVVPSPSLGEGKGLG